MLRLKEVVATKKTFVFGVLLATCALVAVVVELADSVAVMAAVLIGLSACGVLVTLALAEIYRASDKDANT